MMGSAPPGVALADRQTAAVLHAYRRHALQWLIGTPLAAGVGFFALGVSLGRPLLGVFGGAGVLVVCAAPTGLAVGIGGVVRARWMKRLFASGAWESFPVRFGFSRQGHTAFLEGADPDRDAYVLRAVRQRVLRFVAVQPATVLVAGYPSRRVVITDAERNSLIVGVRPRRARALAAARRNSLRPPLTPTAETTVKRELKITLLLAWLIITAAPVLAVVVHWAVGVATGAVVVTGGLLMWWRWNRLPREDSR